MRKSIDKALDTMFAAGDFWTLETVRRLLIRLTRFDDTALTYSLSLIALNEATAKQHDCIKIFLNGYVNSKEVSA